MRLAVIASTLMIVLALAPLLFTGGITQLMFRELVWPLIFGLLASMLVSFTLTALLCANLLRYDAEREKDRRHPVLRWLYFAVDPFQRWLAPFNEGVAHHRAGELETAIDDYGVALETVPHARECTVRVNLALAHEARGDAFAESGDDASARAQWQAGRDALAEGRCPTDAGQGREEQDRAGTVDQRLADKLSDDGSPTASPSPSPSASPSPSGEPQEPSQEQLDQLDELNREGADTRRENEDLGEGGTGDGGYHW